MCHACVHYYPYDMYPCFFCLLTNVTYNYEQNLRASKNAGATRQTSEVPFKKHNSEFHILGCKLSGASACCGNLGQKHPNP